MTELLELFEQMTTKEMAEAFNELPVDKRIEFLNGLTETDKSVIPLFVWLVWYLSMDIM